jgi:hypothetical protein
MLSNSNQDFLRQDLLTKVFPVSQNYGSPQFLLSNVKQEFLRHESRLPVEAKPMPRFPTSSGASVKAVGKELSLVFVPLPYLSKHKADAKGLSTNLSEYMSRQTKNSVERECKDDVWVHQVWFAVFQDCTSYV